MSNNFITINQNKRKAPYRSTSLLFRRTFFLKKNKKNKYTIKVAGLGMGTYYLNGKKITDSVLNQAPSVYDKTVWVDSYDVSNLLVDGKNVFAAEVGNGLYNECLNTTWHFDKAPWRNEKCLYFRLIENNKVLIKGDNKFKTKYSKFRTFNELRGGESVNYRFFEEFYSLNYDDSKWINASFAKYLKTTKLRKLTCEPIKEFEHYKPVKIQFTDEGFLVDFGVNISGYFSIKFKEKVNSKIVVKMAEDVKHDRLNLNNLDCFHNGEQFQTVEILCDGKAHIFKPEFSYFGFRYALVSGVKNLVKDDIESIFVHQDLKQRKKYKFKDKNIQALYDATIRSILSNTYYLLTDCPTREKLGWGNDAQNTTPLFMKLFDTRKFYKKWIVDIVDSINENGEMPGVFPSPNWGYNYGPMMCGGVIFSFPYFYKKYYHSKELYKIAYPTMQIFYEFIENLLGKTDFELGDWTGCDNHKDTPKEYIYDLFMYIYSYIMDDYNEHKNKHYETNLGKYKNNLLKYKPFGQCISSSLLVLNIGDKTTNLEALKYSIKKSNYHIDCGMVGTAFLFRSLSENGLHDLLYRLVFNPSMPSYKYYLDQGFTTLPENLDEHKSYSRSLNHHMYSNILEFFINKN